MAHDRGSRGGDFLNWQPWPLAEHTEGLLAKSAEQTPAALLGILDAAIRANDQALASAAVAAYSKLDQSPRAVFDVLLKYSISEDGALHAEKFYRTVSQEFATTRPGFRWRHIIALSRVAASECGLQVRQRDGLFNLQRARSYTAQPAEVRTAAKLLAQVMRQRANIRAG